MKETIVMTARDQQRAHILARLIAGEVDVGTAATLIGDASWLNQVEVWFSILVRAALAGASHTSPRQVRLAIDRFVEAYNPTATPFEWTKREVHQVDLSRSYANLGE